MSLRCVRTKSLPRLVCECILFVKRRSQRPSRGWTRPENATFSAAGVFDLSPSAPPRRALTLHPIESDLIPMEVVSRLRRLDPFCRWLRFDPRRRDPVLSISSFDTFYKPAEHHIGAVQVPWKKVIPLSSDKDDWGSVLRCSEERLHSGIGKGLVGL